MMDRCQNVLVKRKCPCCNEHLLIGNDNVDKAIYYGGKFYHSDCFCQLCMKRSKMNRKDVAEKWTGILNNLDAIKLNSRKYLLGLVAKESVYDFIRDSYDVAIIPTNVIRKLNEIYGGTFKGMASGIPPEHLLDMWRRKIGMLNRIAEMNVMKGKKMSAGQRISYDLSILVNKYDSYLKWLEKQKILAIEKGDDKDMVIVHQTIGYHSYTEKSNDDDISGLVDDIFQ